ncbi:anthocyanidin 3-O-glucosyltransferase 2-like [Cucumis melo var. makuwa]|uniref:Glycosyltransferase n=2 Tax=Cucumis melo TaxID=3656 RepID=A0A5D3BJL3_CUCMM|nr:anthocyanidin 3-O-glucosyltransferase 2-like [Cucumis melo var. makuwa]
MTIPHHHLVFICTPAIGNLVPAVEFATRLINHDSRFFVTFLSIDIPGTSLVTAYTQSRSSLSPSPNLQFIHLPSLQPPSPNLYHSYVAYLSLIFNSHKPNVKHAISDLQKKLHDSSRIVGIFVDMFTTTFIDVANDLQIPSYLFFASPATFLGLMIHLSKTDHDRFNALIRNSEAEFVLPSYVQSLTVSMLPPTLLTTEDGLFWYGYHGRRYGETKGIVINTFEELEPHALRSLDLDEVPPVYAVGPVVDLGGPGQWQAGEGRLERVVKWLDGQEEGSVVLLSFGSMGSLDEDQVREIAFGLERAGFRFVWVVRQPPKTTIEQPDDYSDLSDVLPEGFLSRTAGQGLVCGWAPQVTILSHRAIGGFVSHCGWNSILESLWFGVPIATWPLYAEQQMNAFEMVKELELAVEIRLDYRKGSKVVTGEELERALRRLMDDNNEVKSRVKRMREKCRVVLVENGSAYNALNSLIEKLTARTL